MERKQQLCPSIEVEEENECQCYEYVAGERKVDPESKKQPEEISTRIESKNAQVEQTMNFFDELPRGLIQEKPFNESEAEVDAESAQEEKKLVEQQLEDDKQEPIHEDHETEAQRWQVTESATLSSKFDQLPSHKVAKATNAPKFLFNILVENMEAGLPINNEYQPHMNWFKKYVARHEKDAVTTRKHLEDMFVDAPHEHRLIRRSTARREVLHRKLCFNRLQLILNNGMIPLKNKVHYLYFCKIYEWRLNRSELVGRFN